MPRGGKRPGAGAKKGVPQKRTLEKMELDRQFRARIAEELTPIAEALLRSALGVEHLQAKDRHGQWTSVTDPAIMATVLNGPEEYLVVSGRSCLRVQPTKWEPLPPAVPQGSKSWMGL